MASSRFETGPKASGICNEVSVLAGEAGTQGPQTIFAFAGPGRFGSIK